VIGGARRRDGARTLRLQAGRYGPVGAGAFRGEKTGATLRRLSRQAAGVVFADRGMSTKKDCTAGGRHPACELQCQSARGPGRRAGVLKEAGASRPDEVLHGGAGEAGKHNWKMRRPTI